MVEDWLDGWTDGRDGRGEHPSCGCELLESDMSLAFQIEGAQGSSIEDSLPSCRVGRQSFRPSLQPVSSRSVPCITVLVASLGGEVYEESPSLETAAFIYRGAVDAWHMG